MTTANDDDAPLTQTTSPKKRFRFRRLAVGIAILVTIGVAAGGYWLMFMRGRVRTDDARIAGLLVDVAPEVAGQLMAVHVSAGDHVTAGQPLFDLDDRIARANVDRAKAAVATAEAGVELARDQLEDALKGPRKHKIAAARADVNRLAAEVALAKTKLERTERLFAKQATVQVELDRAKAGYEAKKQAAESARQSLALLEQGARSEQIDAARTAVKVAEARLGEARASLALASVRLSQTKVAAPRDGVVVRRWSDPGAAAMPGRAVVTLFDPATVRVDANIEEQDLGEVKVGDKVDISIDAYPDVHLSGQVAEILWATNSQFSLIPAEGVSGTFIKVAQRVPLRISLSSPPADVMLAPGLSVEVVIHSHTANAAPSETAMTRAPAP
ncbi:MAG TPA: HlyD family secretion protein [Kofleriaceae bacterium]|nr:HlyD family secretion protein [Kofleriaceae bacterium]